MTATKKRRLKEAKQKRRLARKLATYSLAAGTGLFAAGAAEAVTINDFTGDFAPGNWTFFNEPAGTVAAGAGPSAKVGSLTTTNMDIDLGPGAANLALETNPAGFQNPGWRGGYTMIAPGTGNMSLGWSYSNTPTFGAIADVFITAGGTTFGSLNVGSAFAGGTPTYAIVAGTPITFTLDDHYGSGAFGALSDIGFHISNF